VISTFANGLNNPRGLAADSLGNLFVANAGSNTVQRASPSGPSPIVAGTGTAGPPSGDGSPATSAVLNGPFGVAIDASGNLFIDEAVNSRIRKVSGIAAAGVFPAGTSNSFPKLLCPLPR
jgi:hypothetical protein